MAKKRKSIATSLDEVDRTMYASFCSAANSLSQLYTQAMNHQKLSFQAGERHAMEKLYQWMFRQQEGGSRVTTADVLNYIRESIEYSNEEKSYKKGDEISSQAKGYKEDDRFPPSIFSDDTWYEQAAFAFDLLRLNTLVVKPSSLVDERLWSLDVLGTFTVNSFLDDLNKGEEVFNFISNELDYCGEEPSMSPRAAVHQPHQQQHAQPTMQFTNSSFPASGVSAQATTGQGSRTEHSDNHSKSSVFSNALSSPVRRSLQQYHIAQEAHYPNSGMSGGNGAARNNEPNFLQHQNADPNSVSSNDSSMDMHADSPAHDSHY